MIETQIEGESKNIVSSDEGKPTHKEIRCKKCGRIYYLPYKAQSWRCQNKDCQRFNDLNPEFCRIL